MEFGIKLLQAPSSRPPVLALQSGCVPASVRAQEKVRFDLRVELELWRGPIPTLCGELSTEFAPAPEVTGLKSA